MRKIQLFIVVLMAEIAMRAASGQNDQYKWEFRELIVWLFSEGDMLTGGSFVEATKALGLLGFLSEFVKGAESMRKMFLWTVRGPGVRISVAPTLRAGV